MIEPYHGTDDYRAYTKKTKDDGNHTDEILTRNAKTTAEHFNAFTRRNFHLAEGQTVKYNIYGRLHLHIDDWSQITSTLPPGVSLHRQNEGWPFEYMEIEEGYYYNTISITGDIGWAEIPASIIDLSLEYTAVWRLESSRAYGQVNAQQRNQVGGQKPTTSEIATLLLEQYLTEYQRIEVD